MPDVIMPKLGDAMEEGKIVQWLKNVGDKIAADDPVLEIETDKTNVEVTAEAAGVLEAISFPAGATVPVGSPIARIGDGSKVEKGAPAAAPAPAPAKEAEPAHAGPAKAESAPPAAITPAAPPPTPVALTNGGPYKPFGDSLVGQLPEGLGGTASVIGEPIHLAEAAADGERVKATPLARAMAAANGVALTGIKADGPVTAADVQAALAAPAPKAAPAAAADEDDLVEVQEYNAMRRTIAKRLTEAKQNAPHIYVTVEIDMEEALALREKLNAGAGDVHPKVSVNDLIVKACAVSLMENKAVNSRFDNNKRYISHAAHIGVAVSLPDGLIVPVVRHCQRKSLRQIARETRALAEKARGGKLQPVDYQGGTFTISNMGAIAEVENFAAIINPGEGAILAVSSTRPVPAAVGGQVVVRRRMKVTLSADHRVVDGADAAKFLGSLKRVLENPLEILA